jgi:hypothetical protein
MADREIAGEYATFAHGALKAGDFARALDAAEVSIEFGTSDMVWLKVNRGHALMFLDRRDEACAAYQEHRGTELGPWEEAVVKDFVEYRNDGREHPLMATIEALFKQPPDAVGCHSGPFLPPGVIAGVPFPP